MYCSKQIDIGSAETCFLYTISNYTVYMLSAVTVAFDLELNSIVNFGFFCTPKSYEVVFVQYVVNDNLFSAFAQTVYKVHFCVLLYFSRCFSVPALYVHVLSVHVLSDNNSKVYWRVLLCLKAGLCVNPSIICVTHVVLSVKVLHVLCC